MSKWPHVDPSMAPAWHRNDPNMTPTWSHICPLIDPQLTPQYNNPTMTPPHNKIHFINKLIMFSHNKIVFYFSPWRVEATLIFWKLSYSRLRPSCRHNACVCYLIWLQIAFIFKLYGPSSIILFITYKLVNNSFFICKSFSSTKNIWILICKICFIASILYWN